MQKHKFILNLYKLILLLSLLVGVSYSQAEKVKISDLKVAGKSHKVINYPSFSSFNYVVGQLENSAQIVLWKTHPINFNCHFHSVEPFFDFGSEKYWIDSSLNNPLNQGIDVFEIFLDNYFERIAFKAIDAKKYYSNKDLSKKTLKELNLQENDVLVFVDVKGVMVHSGRLKNIIDNEAIITSKLGGGPVDVMSLEDLIRFYSYTNLYQVRIFRFKK